ncbi:hypothetical protein BT63DRAFT_253692 [Microthyrium microscopicum]|uniref:Uncharacterized protein n=1 Tax=Microthyrium microscopicum TaxID=703497 RepID=A0A6A6UC44_9PEZI|nr:hypothetical protein BT63DRAFT_253692 [Microthyrium microscopicum]
MASSGGHSHGKAGGAMDPNGTPFNQPTTGGYCTDCTVLAAAMDIVFENGTRADIASGVYLHHVIGIVTGNSTGKQTKGWVQACPLGEKLAQGALSNLPAGVTIPKAGSSSAQAIGGFAGGAVDAFVDYFTDKYGKADAGYFIPGNSNLFMSGEVINYLPEAQKVYIRLDLEYVNGKLGVDSIKSPLNVEGCDFNHSKLRNATGKGTVESDDMLITEDVQVICMRK